MAVSRQGYEQNVFINCPFDREYAPIFDAIVFAVFDCGFRPVCARERMNSAQVRIDKITDFIRDSRYSIHDLSRTESRGRFSLPRFNMPLELGIALGCTKFGVGRQRQKTTLILDRRRYRYHKFLSDIAGQDISEHNNQPSRAIEVVRNWLRTESGFLDIPGAEYISRRYRRFKRSLATVAALAHLNPRRLTYVNYCYTISEWLKTNAR
ncbi:MAG: hypothetical protein ACXW4P_04940 [Thermoanaerobaculia bacterium]